GDGLTGRRVAQGAHPSPCEGAVMDAALVARFPRRVEILGCSQYERAAVLRPRSARSVRDVAQIGHYPPRMSFGQQTASAGAAMAVVEHHRQMRTAIEDSVEIEAKLLVADVRGAGAGICRYERFVQEVRLVGAGVAHLRAVPCKIEENHVIFACGVH